LHIFHSITTSFFRKRMRQLDYVIAHPEETQEGVWKDLIHKARFTEWGKQHDYESIKNIDSYQSRVPISTYEVFAPFIHRVMKGEKNILWPSTIKWFAKSSGTTDDRSKFIPVTPESLKECHFKGGKDLAAFYIDQVSSSKILQGKTLGLGGSLQYNTFNSNRSTFYGDVSAVMTKNLPLWVQWMRVPSLKIALMDQWESKIEAMAREIIHEDVRSIAGVPTWMLILLKRMMELTGKNSVTDIWPNLELYMHGAVSFAPYKDIFNSLFSKPIHYLETYNASEGFFGMQDQLGKEEMLLMLDYGVFYEFIPIEEIGKQHPKAILLDQVEVDKNYAIVISTNAGLWRYMIGDTIRFTSLKPYRMKITGRTKHFINAFGEELVVENAEIAVTQAAQATGAIVANFTVAPIYMNENQKGGHEWIIEFTRLPSNLSIFTSVLDETLKKVNSDYEAKRSHNLALQLPLVRVVPEGTFYNWMKKKGKLGAQYKVPRLFNTREYIDDILNVDSTSHH